jgi:hypothetical protein
VSILVTRARPELKARRSNRFPPVLMGYAIECLVEAYALIGAGGRLTTARPDSDVDHKDFIVDEKGGYRSIYLQVKGSARSHKRTVRVVVRYPKGRVLSSRRLVYVFCLLDAEALGLTRMWVVPAPDFSRLATRLARPGGYVDLQFVAGRSGKWTRFEIDPTLLGARLLEIIQRTPRQKTARRIAVRAAA